MYLFWLALLVPPIQMPFFFQTKITDYEWMDGIEEPNEKKKMQQK